jgi:hypothetical protein
VRRSALAALGLLFALAACNGGDSVERATPVRAVAKLPSQVLGLKVVPENVTSDIRGVSRTYVDSLGLFSLRESDDLLRATIQIGRFNDVAEPRKERFRNAIVAQLGSTVPTQVRVGKKITYLTSGSKQSIFSWFDDEGFYVLSIRSDYPFSRTLLRRLVETRFLR